MAQLQKKVRFGKYMGFGAAVASAVFLFNPDIALIDIFPDFIGYLLLTLSLRFARDLSPHFENAWKRFRLLTLVTVAKFIALFWVMGVLTNALEKPTMLLLLSFVFSILELIWGIPAWFSFIEGLILHAQTAGGEYPLLERGAKSYRPGKNVSVSFRNTTVFFMIAKAFFANISEFSALSEHSYDDKAFNWYRFVGLYRILAVFIGAVIGVIWLVCALRFFIGIIKDEKLIESAKQKYETQVLPNTGLFIRRDIAFLLTVLCAAALLSADFYIDKVNFIPDTLSAVLWAWTFIKLKPYYAKYKMGLAITGVYGVLTVVGAIMSGNFVSGAWVEKTWANREVFIEFITMYPVRVAEAVFFFITVLLALNGVRAVIDSHCGYIPSTMSEEYRSSRLAAIRKEVCAKVWLCLAIAAITAAVSGLYEFILSLDLFISPIWWIISFVASLAFFASAVYMMSAVNEEVESRYMLD